MTNNKKEREAFEAHCKRSGLDPIELRWWGWQARAALEKPQGDVVELLHDIIEAIELHEEDGGKPLTKWVIFKKAKAFIAAMNMGDAGKADSGGK